MAKESIKARERKRAKMVAKYAAKRAALKEIVRTGEPEEVEKAVKAFGDYIRTQVLADDITIAPNEGQEVDFDEFKLNISITKF